MKTLRISSLLPLIPSPCSFLLASTEDQSLMKLHAATATFFSLPLLSLSLSGHGTESMHSLTAVGAACYACSRKRRSRKCMRQHRGRRQHSNSNLAQGKVRGKAVVQGQGKGGWWLGLGRDGLGLQPPPLAVFKV